MHIAAASIRMQAQHQAQQSLEVRESLDARVGAPATRTATIATTDQFSFSQEALSAAASSAPSSLDTEDGYSPKDKLAVDLIRHLYKLITGHDMVLRSAGGLQQALQSGGTPPTTTASSAATASASGAPASSGFSLDYEASATYRESESTRFAASGVIYTADGKTIDFTAEVNMSREFAETRQASLKAGDAAQPKVDPLVLNYGGHAAELTGTHFAFDLDSDGDSEQLAELGAGSALLALDKNGNGTVDNGQELFGPTRGDGFAELAQYDADGNGFLDAADPAYDKLRLWQRDGSGGASLVALGQVGIGAIYLGRTATPFQLNDAQNHNLGQVASTGLFFREDGGAGTVQQVDYTV
jgi:hypothetical protein